MEYGLGIIVALIVEFLKAVLPDITEKYRKAAIYLILFVISLAGAYFWFMLEKSNYYENFLQIAIMAAAFHNLVLRRVEEIANDKETDKILN